MHQYRACYLKLKELLGGMTLAYSLPLEQMRQRVVLEFQNATLPPVGRIASSHPADEMPLPVSVSLQCFLGLST